jgi:hypothetical protein
MRAGKLQNAEVLTLANDKRATVSPVSSRSRSSMGRAADTSSSPDIQLWASCPTP